MHNKKINNSKSQKIFQGLRPLSRSIPHGLKKILRKSGYNFSNIVDNWTKMVGEEISGKCYPYKIKTGKDMNNGTLILNVLHGKELEVEYSKKEILDKINSFFGYSCISVVQLKIVQNKKKEKEQMKQLKPVNKDLEKKIYTIKNDELKNSLSKLIKAYNAKNN
jgi:hypothetical protein|tara:strand:+ start:2326 stop:2817 length:492 start_codon:yes stop_codon:yes gene_type:complete